MRGRLLEERPLRICLVTREHPRLSGGGGIGTYTENLANGLAGLGHAVTVLAQGSGDELSPASPGHVRLVGVQAAERWRLPAGNRYVGQATRSAAFAWAAARTFRRLDAQAAFDVVEAPEYQGWGAGVLALASCPKLLRLHTHTALLQRLNEQSQSWDARICHALEAFSVSRADRILANSEALAKVALDDFSGVMPAPRVGVLPLGIDTERFARGASGPVRARWEIPLDAPLLLFVGRLERRKGVETLMEAFVRVAHQHPQAHLMWVGFSTATGSRGANMLPQLQARAIQAGLSARMRWVGAVPYAELPDYFAAAHVFAAPSAFEPFGMVYLEAMASGCPVVACAAGGVPEIIQHEKTGYLVSPFDAHALAHTLDVLLASPDMRWQVAARARQEVRQRFSLSVISQATVRHYRQLLRTDAREAA